MKKTFIILAAVALLGLVALWGCGSRVENSKTEKTETGKLEKIYSLYPEDKRMWEHIFDSEEPYEFAIAPFGVILPHHMVAAFELAKFYEGLAEVANPSVVVVVGPNHYENGEANIQTCLKCVFASVNGDVGVQSGFVEKMVKDKQAEALEETFIKEHAIYTHAPFIKNFFPEAKIVPIVLQWKMPKAEVRGLSEWLDENLPEDALVIASVDFSHYIPVEAADFHDQSSFATITNFDFENVYDLEIDSPSSIYLLLDLMNKRGYQKARRFAHSNLQDFVKMRSYSTTSHQFFGFFKGEVKPFKGVGIMSFGNNGSGLGLIDNWNWERGKGEGSMEEKQVQGPDGKDLLKDIKGEEDRFFSGADFLVFGLNDGCVLKEQNGMKVSFCKNKFENQAADLVYMLYDFEGAINVEVAKKFIDQGVDIFVGRGGEKTKIADKEVRGNIADKSGINGSWQSYNGGLIFDQLGDFMIDGNSEGEIIDLYVTPENYFIYKFPIVIKNSYPSLKRTTGIFENLEVVKIAR